MAQNKLSNDQKKTLNSSRIEPFSSLLSPLIKESLIETGKDKYRKGTLLLPVFVVWLVLAITMRRDLNYNQVIEWMISSYRWATMILPAVLLSDGAISHARTRIGVEVFKILFFKLTLKFRQLSPDFHGYVTIMFDGVVLNMPDSEENTQEFGKHKTSRGSSGFPMMRVVTLMTAVARVHLDVAFASYRGKGTGERSLVEKILNRFSLDNGLFLFDAGFFSFKLLSMLKKHNYIMKITKNIALKPLKGCIFFDGSYLAEIKGIRVRVIDVHIKGFRPFRLITSLLDESISATEIVRHYHKRWDIEISYDEIKTHQCATLRGQAPTILRSKKAELVKQELYALLISYNMTRWLMFQSAEKHGVHALQLSFLDCLQWIIDAVDKANGHDYLSKLIAESFIDRPGRKRSNPRVIKVKMSKFKRKRKGDKGEKIDYEKHTQIIPPKEAIKAMDGNTP
jgi:hypothetical protein